MRAQPIPLDLLTLANFTDPPTQRSSSLLKKSFKATVPDKYDGGGGTPGAAGSPETATDSRLVFPCTIHHNGRLGGLYTVFADSLQLRTEWKQKLDEAIGLRKVVQESNKVFEVETLSADTFLVPSIASSQGQAWNHEHAFTGKVTSSVPFREFFFVCSFLGYTDVTCSNCRWTWLGRNRVCRRSLDWIPS